MSDAKDDAPDFTEIVAQKMVAEQRQQLRAEQGPVGKSIPGQFCLSSLA